jgi:hypothetical protein
MDSISLVKTALKYFDENSDKYENILKSAKYVKFVAAENDMSHNVMKFFDKNKNEMFRSRYEIIGLYSNDINTWTWSWAIPNFKKNNTNIARKLWNYGSMLDPSDRYLKTELVTSRFRVSDFVQLDIHVAISSYISKNPFVYKYGIARFEMSNGGEYEIINEKQIDQEGFIYLNEDIDSTVLVYYMFLLDYENLDIPA